MSHPCPAALHDRWHADCWEVRLAAPHSGEGSRCKSEYIPAVVYSHLERPGSCFLDISSASDAPLPTHAQREAQCDAGAQFTTPFFCLRHWFLDMLEPHGTFLDISCSLSTPLILNSPRFLFICIFLASTPLGCVDLNNEKGRGVRWQLDIRQRKEQVLILEATDICHPPQWKGNGDAAQ